MSGFYVVERPGGAAGGKRGGGEFPWACDHEELWRPDVELTSTPNQFDEPVRECLTPTEIVVPADELLVVHFVALREQHVAHVTAGLKHVATGANLIDFERAGVHVEPDRQLRTSDELLRQPSGFRRRICQSPHHMNVIGRP